MPSKRGSTTRSSARRRKARMKQNYTWKILPVLYKEQIDESTNAVEAWLLNQETLETRTQTILEAQSIPNEEWPHYFAFARRVLMRALNFTGPTLDDELDSLRNEWVLRGKILAVLNLIIAAMQTLAAEIKAAGGS